MSYCRTSETNDVYCYASHDGYHTLISKLSDCELNGNRYIDHTLSDLYDRLDHLSERNDLLFEDHVLDLIRSDMRYEELKEDFITTLNTVYDQYTEDGQTTILRKLNELED